MKNNIEFDISKLTQALSCLKTKSEIEGFLRDICTNVELQAMAHRLYCARLLNEGKTYNEVIELTGISAATVSRISKCLNTGTGYSTVFKRLRNK